MKRWKKRLTLFSLLAAGFLIWDLSGVGVKAEEAVPQANLTIKNSEITVSNNKVRVSYEPKTFSEEDFKEDYVIQESTTIDDMAKEGKYITGGTLTFTVLSGNNQTMAVDYYDDNWFIDYNTTPITMSDDSAKFKYPYDYGYEHNYEEDSILGEPGAFTVYNVRSQPYMIGCYCIITYQQNDYLVHFPVKVICDKFFSGMEFWRENNNVADRFRDIEQELEGDQYIWKLDKYDSNVAVINACVPQYALGATGENTVDVWYRGGQIKAYKSEIALCKRDEPLMIKVKNLQGKEKEISVIVEMPWKLSINNKVASNYSPIIYVNDEKKDNTTLDDVSYGSTVKVAFTIPSGKKLTGIKAINTSNFSDVYDLKYIIDGSNISFQMPKETITITEIKVEDYTTEARNITATPVVQDGSETDFAIIEKKVDNQNVSTASEGKTVVLTAGEMKQNYTSLCGYQFDHWESTSITISSEDSKKNVLTFTMPDKDVDVKAVYVKTGVSITIGTSNSLAGNTRITNHNPIQESSSSTSDSKTTITEYCRAGQYRITMTNLNTMGYRFLGWVDENRQPISTTDTDNVKWNNFIDADVNFTYLFPTITVTDETAHMTFIASFEAKTGCTLNFTSSDEKQGTVSAKIQDTDITSGDNTLYDGDEVTLNAVAKTGYRFAGWKVVTPATDSGIQFTDEKAETTTFTMPKIPSGNVTIQGVFEVNPSYQSPDCELTKVELLTKDGTLVKQANRSGTKFTIKLSAKDMSLEEAGNLTNDKYLLRLTYPEKATAKMDGGFGDGENGDDRWLTGISNVIGKGRSETFIITAENGTNKNTYTIAIEYDDRPTLTAGTVKRVSDTEASVGFRSSSAGTYYWAVVDAGEAKPDIPTNGAGTTFKYADRENTIKLTSLTAGAKDLYIVVKNDDDSTNVKISDVLKISIPAFGGAETTYKVNVTGNLPGGKVAVDKTEAKAGETVTVTVTPDSGKKMTANSLIYSQSSAPYEVVHIDEKTKQFIMPAYELSVSCRFEDENSSTTPETTTGKIGAFVVNGVSGTVDNTTGTITVTLPNGTDLTSLAPVITISGAKSISPASGATVDLSSPVTYTLTLEDGTTKTYTVRAYVEGPSKSDQLWNDMLNNVDGSPDHSGSKTWWKKAKDLKKHNDYPEYW